VSESSAYNEIDLIRRAQSGDDKAFESLVKSCDHRVMNIACSMTGSLYDAEEVYQETFLRAYSALATFRHHCSFTTWVIRIAVNQSITHRKKQKLRSLFRIWTPIDDLQDILPAPQNDTYPGKELSNRELLQEISKGLNRLSNKERSVFTLRYLQEFKIKEIADITRNAEGTVKNLIFRATQKMKKHLKAYVEDQYVKL